MFSQTLLLGVLKISLLLLKTGHLCDNFSHIGMLRRKSGKKNLNMTFELLKVCRSTFAKDEASCGPSGPARAHVTFKANKKACHLIPGPWEGGKGALLNIYYKPKLSTLFLVYSIF
jgi:hypothetical protein